MNRSSTFTFRKSSYSGNNGSCIEFASTGGSTFAIRDSKDKSGPILSFTARDIRAFVTDVRDGRL